MIWIAKKYTMASAANVRVLHFVLNKYFYLCYLDAPAKRKNTAKID